MGIYYQALLTKQRQEFLYYPGDGDTECKDRKKFDIDMLL